LLAFKDQDPVPALRYQGRDARSSGAAADNNHIELLAVY
jgi:hypothetical protein